jgi:hypothetical protein
MLLNEQKLPPKFLSTSLYLSVYSVIKVENECDSRTLSRMEGLPEFLVVCWLDMAKVSSSASPVSSSARLQPGPLQEYRPRVSITAWVPSLSTEKVTAMLREICFSQTASHWRVPRAVVPHGQMHLCCLDYQTTSRPASMPKSFSHARRSNANACPPARGQRPTRSPSSLSRSSPLQALAVSALSFNATASACFEPEMRNRLRRFQRSLARPHDWLRNPTNRAASFLGMHRQADPSTQWRERCAKPGLPALCTWCRVWSGMYRARAEDAVGCRVGATSA